jgi:hypothetical protein
MKMLRSRRSKKVAVAAAAGAAVAMLIPGVAYASSTGCNGSSCTSGTISANTSGHWIKWHVDSGVLGGGCSWRVRDVDTDVVVGSGRVGAFSSKSGQINALVGRYHIELYNCDVDGGGGLSN